MNFLSLLTVLQIFLLPGNTQIDINQRNYESNVGGVNNPYWPYQTIKSDGENQQQYRRVIPCLNRRLNDPNQRSPNAEWIPTFKFTVTKPAAKEGSLKEENDVGEQNNVFSGTKNADRAFDQKINTLTVNSLRSSLPSEDDCETKIATQEIFRRSMPNSVEPIEKQINLRSSQEEETISPVNTARISDECNEKKDTNLNSRRSNTDNEIMLPALIENDNRTNGKSIDHNYKNDVTSSFDGNEERNYNNNDDQEQTNTYGVTKMAESSVMLIQNSRTCYACSSASDPRCWNPSRRTTVKYCRKGHDACVTRTFRSSYGIVLTRDCGRTCEDTSFPGVIPNYKSCSICHYDLCNSAHRFRNHYLILLMILITVVKALPK